MEGGGNLGRLCGGEKRYATPISLLGGAGVGQHSRDRAPLTPHAPRVLSDAPLYFVRSTLGSQ